MTDNSDNSINKRDKDGKFEFPQGIHDLFAEVVRQQQALFRTCKTMFAGFKATGETDIHYMDTYMDCLHDFMDQGSDTEELYLEYIDHIATFDPEEAAERKDDLEDFLGYKTEVAYAAAYIAREICRKKKGDDGVEYFRENCWRVGERGYNWKAKVAGFLYHIIQDFGFEPDALLVIVKEKIREWMTKPDNDFWKYDFDDELMQFAGETCHMPTEKEWAEISDALTLLDHHTAKDRDDYTERFKDHFLPIKVKLEDLKDKPLFEEDYKLFLQMLWDCADEREEKLKNRSKENTGDVNHSIKYV